MWYRDIKLQQFQWKSSRLHSSKRTGLIHSYIYLIPRGTCSRGSGSMMTMIQWCESTAGLWTRPVIFKTLWATHKFTVSARRRQILQTIMFLKLFSSKQNCYHCPDPSPVQTTWTPTSLIGSTVLAVCALRRHFGFYIYKQSPKKEKRLCVCVCFWGTHTHIM